MITTFDEAYRLVKKLKICTIFESPAGNLPSLWEHIGLPDKQRGERGWGEKVTAVWEWKNRLPATFPDEIFYGKTKAGIAVLMTIDYLRAIHFKSAYQAIESLPPLCGYIYEMVRVEPRDTTALRNEAVDAYGCSKSQFATALKKLQGTLNIVRSNDPDIERDTWLTFQELYPDIWEQHVSDG